MKHGKSDSGPTERRAKPPPTTSDELLRQLPARILLDRMPTPAIGVGKNGALIYGNGAAAALLGFDSVDVLLERTLPSLLGGRSPISPQDCVSFLEDVDDAVVDWSHTGGFAVRTTVSTLLLRATDPILLVYLNDVSELLWAEASQLRRA